MGQMTGQGQCLVVLFRFHQSDAGSKCLPESRGPFDRCRVGAPGRSQDCKAIAEQMSVGVLRAILLRACEWVATDKGHWPRQPGLDSPNDGGLGAPYVGKEGRGGAESSGL